MEDRKALAVFALQEEEIKINIPGFDIINIITGIGKARAAMTLMKAIMTYQPSLVINIGTSGTLEHNVGDIFCCTHFIDRDFKTLQLPGIEYELYTNNKLIDYIPCIISSKENTNYRGTVNTGDNFITGITSIQGDIVDMEAFPLAQVCIQEKIPFLAVKYVTDIIGNNSINGWTKQLNIARREMKEYLNKYLTQIPTGLLQEL